MDYQTFILLTLFAATVGGIMGFLCLGQVLPRYKILLALVGFMFCGGMVAAAIDSIHEQETTICTATNITVVDTFHEGGFLGLGSDLTAKLSNGHIVHYSDPYEWKRVKPGDPFTIVIVKYHSFIDGNLTGINYHNKCSKERS